MDNQYEDYDDDYDDNQDDLENKYKHYFKFDPEAWDAWGKMLYDSLNDIVDNGSNEWYIISNIDGFPKKWFPVSSYFSNAGKDKTFQYLGSNYQNAKVWKNKYFICDPLQHTYINHIQSHAVHFMQQPHYYKGLFDILN